MKILSLREVSDLKKPAPYSYTLGSGKQKLFMFGAVHFRDADDPQFVTMKDMWREFMALKGAKIALVESGVGSFRSTFEGSVASSREEGATQWLAFQEGMGILCADLEFVEMLKHLSEKFESNDIAYWVISREMFNRIRNPGGRSAEDVLLTNLARYRRAFKEIGVDTDRTWFDTKHTEMFGPQSIDDDDFWKKLASWSAPKVFNDIIEFESRLRNERIYSVIEHLWKLGRSIFVTYGATHAVQLEPALHAMVEGK